MQVGEFLILLRLVFALRPVFSVLSLGFSSVLAFGTTLFKQNLDPKAPHTSNAGDKKYKINQMRVTVSKQVSHRGLWLRGQDHCQVSELPMALGRF